MTKQPASRLDHGEYLDERKELYRYQQATYDGFERTLTALAGSFLAFSVAFLGYLAKTAAPNQPALVPGSAALLVATLVAFSVSLLSLLMVFFVNARSFTVEIKKLEDALDDIAALERPNRWRTASLCIYGTSVAAFVIGLASLLVFCKRNFGL